MRTRKDKYELEAIRQTVEFVGRMSDSLIKIGPFSLGIDGVLSWVPGVGEIYSIAAGCFLIMQGFRAGVPMGTLLSAVGMLGLRTSISAVPLAGAAFADVFTAHKWTAKMIIREIDRQLSTSRAPLQPDFRFGIRRSSRLKTAKS